VAELVPDLDASERLELLAAMDEDDMRASLAFLVSFSPQTFDYCLVRDRELVERLQDRLDHQYDDDPEPYCSTCGTAIGIFLGQQDKGYQHYRGAGTVASPVEIFDADHEPTVAWRENGRYACCRHCTHGEGQPADRHSKPCADGCNGAGQ
jgi:hypothetical protein